jgi:hypothetical protein
LAEGVDAVLRTLARWRQDAYAEYRYAERSGKLMQMCELNAMVQVYDACRELVMGLAEVVKDCAG